MPINGANLGANSLSAMVGSTGCAVCSLPKMAVVGVARNVDGDVGSRYVDDACYLRDTR